MVPHNLPGCITLIFLLNAPFLISCDELEDTARPEVTIAQGTLQGITVKTRYSRDISVYLGIPYGKPPTGNLRFAEPVEADSWDGVLDASVDANACVQLSGDSVMGSEDCLYLNVYTPQLPSNSTSSLLPVLVSIHGGAFKTGSAASSSRGPDYLMDKDFVYVAGNYRLDMIGFLSTGDEVASGNWGLKDQVLILKWVQKNIEYFGGDPNQVTLAGESAGGASVHILSLSDATIGLFHRYITQSSSALATWSYRPRTAYSSRAFAVGEYLNCPTESSDSLISCLRTKDASELMSASSQFIVWETFPGIVWGPTDEPDIEGAILTDTPANLFAAGKFRDLPWITGVDRNEGLLHTAGFYVNSDMFEEFLANFDTLLPVILSWTYQADGGAAWTKAVKSYYFNDDLTTDRAQLLTNLTMLATDANFFYPIHSGLQQQYALAKNPQYFYTFEYRGTFSFSVFYGGQAENLGVAHSDELIYLFPMEWLSFIYGHPMTEEDYKIVDDVIQLWTSFAINGTPSTSGLDTDVTWGPYSSEDNYLRIGNEAETTLSARNSFHKERMAFWAALDAIQV